MALLHGDAVAGTYMSFRAIPGSHRSPPNPQPLGPLQGARGVGRGMAWIADFRGFPCTLTRCPMGGRHGADNAVGGLLAAAPQGGYGLVSALPLAGGTKKMACWVAVSVGAKIPLHGDPGDADGFVALRSGRGNLYVFSSHTWLATITP